MLEIRRHPMKDLIFPLFAVQTLAIAQDSLSTWERLAEKWGIGLVGLVLLYLLARWTARREENAAKERERRAAASDAERAALMTRNNELQEQQLAAQAQHARKLEMLVKDGNARADDHAAALRMLVRKMRCVAGFDLSAELQAAKGKDANKEQP